MRVAEAEGLGLEVSTPLVDAEFGAHLHAIRCRTDRLFAALLLLQYATCRFAIEMFRGDEVRGVWFGGHVSTSQIVSLALFGFGLWLLAKRRATPALGKA